MTSIVNRLQLVYRVLYWHPVTLFALRAINRVTHRHREPYARVFQGTVYAYGNTTFTRCLFRGSARIRNEA